MNLPLSRRNFLQLSAASATTAWLAACQSSPKRKVTQGPLRHAAIGVGGMGKGDLRDISSHDQVEIVALCDVDFENLKAAGALHPEARQYRDWREMLEREADNLDSVCVSTPDHMHAPISMSAMALGLHVYCQKPLTHTVVEARTIRAAAKAGGLTTQMGIQNHSNKFYRTALKAFQENITGPVSEVHVWTDRPAGWWPQDVPRPEGSDPVPGRLAWDSWLGVAPDRLYKKGAYHSFVWRGRKDFGTGAQGDMACHLMDPALWFLDLGDPLNVTSVGPKPNADSFPAWSRVAYEFAGTPVTTPEKVMVTWHDGGKKPQAQFEQFGIAEPFDNGSLFVGPKGALMVSPYVHCKFFGAKDGEVELELDVQSALDHYHQWVDACLGKGEATANFDFAGALTEVALLGNVALEFPGEKLDWDAKNLSFPSKPAANRWLHKDYREGWEVTGL